MAVNKNFVVKNGLEVAEDLLIVDSTINKVGVGSTVPAATFAVDGGVAAVDGLFVGVLTAYNGLDVGSGGTVINVNGQAGYVGVNTTATTHSLEVVAGAGGTAIDVTGGINVSAEVIVGAGLTVTGASDLTSVDADRLIVSGVSTFSNVNANGIGGTSIIISGVSTFSNINADGIGGTSIIISGVSTFSNINADGIGGTSIIISGVSTFSGVNADGIGATSISVSGISTFNGVKVGDPAGVITATSASGIVTYYGDGSNLTGIATQLTATIGVGSEGSFIGAGITQINFNSTTGTAIAVNVPPETAAGVATVTITPGASIGLVIALGG